MGREYPVDAVRNFEFLAHLGHPRLAEMTHFSLLEDCLPPCLGSMQRSQVRQPPYMRMLIHLGSTRTFPLGKQANEEAQIPEDQLGK